MVSLECVLPIGSCILSSIASGKRGVAYVGRACDSHKIGLSTGIAVRDRSHLAPRDEQLGALIRSFGVLVEVRPAERDDYIEQEVRPAERDDYIEQEVRLAERDDYIEQEVRLAERDDYIEQEVRLTERDDYIEQEVRLAERDDYIERLPVSTVVHSSGNHGVTSSSCDNLVPNSSIHLSQP